MSNPHLIYGSAGLIEEIEAEIDREIRKLVAIIKNKSSEIMKGNELDIQITDRSNAYGNSRIYRYRINGESVLRFDQIPYPECCGIAIIKNFSANGDMSKTDFLDTMDGFIKDMQKNDRFSKVLFYTNAGSNGDRLFSQIPDVVVLDPFKNRRSGNTLVGFEINLLEKESTREGWHSLDLGDDDFDEEINEEHDEEEDNDPFGLRDLIQEADRNIPEPIQITVAGQASLDLRIQQPGGSVYSAGISQSTSGGLRRTLAEEGLRLREYIDSDGMHRIDYVDVNYSDNPTGINRSSDNS